MANGKHTGKVLIKMRDEPEIPMNLNQFRFEPVPRAPLTALTKPHANEKKSYLITGGLGGFGFELARWLISRGAKKLVTLFFILSYLFIIIDVGTEDVSET